MKLPELVTFAISLITVLHVAFAVEKFSAIDDEKVLNIHLVPHTHDDVGWVRTVDQYYYGWNTSISNSIINGRHNVSSVRSILDTVMQELAKNENRTFTYVELKFFSMWWDEQTNATKAIVRDLVSKKQLDFANGGWCMHDEGATHFMGMIDQTTLGHAFLKNHLGIVPTVGWQLDPFGHSATQASLMAGRVGFDALYFGRIDYRDLEKRRETQETHGLWESSPNLREQVFWGLTGSYSGNYNAPKGFRFETRGNGPLPAANETALLEKMKVFMERAKTQSDETKGNNIMMTMGGDFEYANASFNFGNIELLMESVSKYQSDGSINVSSILGPRFESVNLFYSTPAYFTLQKHKEGEAFASSNDGTLLWKSKTDDFFPYSNCKDNCYWTGYFTSRAGLKRMERVASSFLLAARQIESLPGESIGTPLLKLEDAVGVVQHHDGVSGTSKQHVAYDYAKKIQEGMDRAAKIVELKLKHHLLEDIDSLDLNVCQFLNETMCTTDDAPIFKYDDFFVVVYNALSQRRSSVVGIPVPESATYDVAKVKHLGVDDEHSENVTSFVVPPLKDGSDDLHIAYFETGPIDPLGASVFLFKKTGDAATVETSAAELADTADTFDVSNGVLTVHFNATTGKMTKIQNNDDGSTLDISQEWGYYWSYNKLDGAYRFVPDSDDQAPTMLEAKTGVSKVIETDSAVEVHVEYEEPWVKQVTRLLPKQPYVEVEFTVGPVPVSLNTSKDVITRYNTPIQTNGTFYTDANGREFMKRVRNFRPSFEIDEAEPVAGNYYPINAAAYIEDLDASLSVVIDRSQGGASLVDGSIELMVQRRTTLDDHRGLHEALNETDGGIEAYPPYGNSERKGEGVMIKGKHRLVVGKGFGGASAARSQMDDAFSSPLVLMASAPPNKVVDFKDTSLSALQSSLPDNIMLVTFARIHHVPALTFLVRLGHQYGQGEDSQLGKPVVIDMDKLFAHYKVVSMTEKTLTGNRDYSEWMEKRLSWSVAPDDEWNEAHERSNDDGNKIEMKPMEIRTFEVILEETSSHAPLPVTPAPSTSGSIAPSSSLPPGSSPRPTSRPNPPVEQQGTPSKASSSSSDSLPVPPAVIALIAVAAVFTCFCGIIYCRMRDRQETLPQGVEGLARPDYSTVFENELT